MAVTQSGSHERRIHEAAGPAFDPRQAGGAIGVGVNSLLALGVIPVLLGALADEHRLGAAGIGLAAMAELLTMGVVTGLAGMVLKPRRLRLIGVLASLALVASDLAVMGASGPAVLALRAAAGAAEGLLLWITVGMIARTVTPERWAGVFFTSQVFAQLALAVVLALWVMPRFGANGGFAALAVASLIGVAPALAGPRRFEALPMAPGDGGAPPLRGWIALGGILVYISANGAVSVYLQSLAHQAGLSANVARTALWTSLAAQVAGGAAATALAGRVRYFTVFIITTAAFLVVWYVFSRHASAWLFIAANAMGGFFLLLLSPFVVPMMIDADPSRRAAMQSGAAQLLGAALGPLLASRVVGDRDVHGVLWLAVGLMLAGLAVVAGLRFTGPRLASATLEA
jgi:DHA1 family inner membrane transport protein